MIPVGRLAPIDQWDQNMLDLLFANELYPTGLTFSRHEGYPSTDGCVLIIPGRYWFQKANQISESIARFQWVLAIRTGDEEDQLQPDRIYHPNIKWWVQTPKVGVDYDDARLFGVGFPPHFNHLKQQNKDTDVFLSAQNTHDRRTECFAALENIKATKVVGTTDGFTQGMDKDEYALWMSAAKVAPCPSGAVSPDSFRLYEALEAHTVPIADDSSPVYDSQGYWRMLFPDAPFPILESYEQLPGYVDDQLRQWPDNVNRITEWWINYKRDLGRWIRDDLRELGVHV